jgi:hypothetical protein
MSRLREYRVPGLLAAAVFLIGVAITVVAIAQGESAQLGGRNDISAEIARFVSFPYVGVAIAVILTNSTGARLWVVRGAALAAAAFGAALLLRAALGVKELHGNLLLYCTLIPLPLALVALVAYFTETDPKKEE